MKGSRLAFYKYDKQNTVASDPVLGPKWHPTKNPGLDPHKLTTGSGKKATFLCSCGHEYVAIIRRAGKCPVCTGRVATPQNCLATTHPGILKEWDNDNNGSNTPYNLTKNTTTLINLKCANGHSYQAHVHWWVRGRRCPYCDGKKVDIKDSLAAKYPDVAKEWDQERNGDLTPTEVLPKSNVKAWWKCRYGHSWKARIFSRTGILKRGNYTYHGTGCPICARSSIE